MLFNVFLMCLKVFKVLFMLLCVFISLMFEMRFKVFEKRTP